MTRLTQERKLQGVLALGLLASVGGIAYAVTCGTAIDGQRGGAIAVALSFLALFAARNTPLDTLELKDGSGALVLESGTAEARINVLRTAIAAMLDSQRLEKRYLTLSSVTGTLVWGFGDLVAGALGAAL